MGYEAFTNARDASLRNLDNSLSALDEGRVARVNRAAGNALQNNDYAGASSALYQGGNLRDGMVVQEAGRTQQTADREQTRTAVLAVMTGLRHVPGGPAERRAQLQTIAPRLAMYGVTPDQLGTITDQDLTDQGLDSHIASLGGEVETGSYMNAGNGRIVQTRPYGQGVDEAYAAPPDPMEQEYLRARIDATRAQVPLREAQASRANRPPAGRSSGASRTAPSAAPTGGGLPAGFTVRRR